MPGLTKEEREWIKQLYSQNALLVQNVIKGILERPNREDIESCCQNTFLCALEHISTLKKHNNPAGWLVVTAKHMAQKCSHTKQIQCSSIETLEKLSEDSFEDHVCEDLCFQQMLSDHIAEMITSGLTHEERLVLHLKYQQRKSYHEIRSLLGIPIVRLRVIESRANRKIRIALKGWAAL